MNSVLPLTSLLPQEIFDHGDLADLPAVGLENADLHLDALQRHRIGDRPFELRDVVHAADAVEVGWTMRRENSNGTGNAAKPPPQCLALLLCQRTFQDSSTGAFTLFDLIHTLKVSAFPGRSPPFEIFVELYDGIGAYDLTIEVHDRSDGATIARATLTDLDFIERLAKMDLSMPVQSVGLPRAGRYDVIALVRGQELARQYFIAEAENGEKT